MFNENIVLIACCCIGAISLILILLMIAIILGIACHVKAIFRNSNELIDIDKENRDVLGMMCNASKRIERGVDAINQRTRAHFVDVKNKKTASNNKKPQTNSRGKNNAKKQFKNPSNDKSCSKPKCE